MISPARLRAAVELAVLALLAFLAAVGVTTTARLALDDASLGPTDREPQPRSAAPEPLDAFQTIAARDVFNAGVPPPSGPRAALRVWGVGMHGDRAYAVVEDAATGRQSLVQVGEAIGDARIAAIAWDAVTLRRPQGDERLPVITEPRTDGATAGEQAALPDSAPDVPIRQTGPGSFIVERRALAGAVDNTSGLLTQLRAVPEVHDGRPVGFRLFQITPDSVFTRLGLRNGDVVQRVNGSTLADPASLLGFLQRLRDEPRVALDIVRAGAPQTMVYDLR